MPLSGGWFALTCIMTSWIALPDVMAVLRAAAAEGQVFPLLLGNAARVSHACAREIHFTVTAIRITQAVFAVAQVLYTYSVTVGLEADWLRLDMEFGMLAFLICFLVGCFQMSAMTVSLLCSCAVFVSTHAILTATRNDIVRL